MPWSAISTPLYSVGYAAEGKSGVDPGSRS